MKHLLIIGARGFGRQVYFIALNSIGYKEQFDVKGYLDDKTDALDNFNHYPPICGSVEDYVIQEDDVFICALGDVYYKKKYVDIILSKGGVFTNIIHKKSSIGINSSIGTGVIISDGVHIGCDSHVGSFNTFNVNAIVGHDCIIGDFCQLNCMSFMGGFSQIGSFVTLQTSSIVLPHKKLGSNCSLGASSVVIRNFGDNVALFGNPAKKIEY